MKYSIENFTPPLKKELPLLHYDIALYCSEFCKAIHNIWPDYLPNFKEQMLSYAAQVKRLKPKISEISPDIRIYFLDNRLSLLFAALDETGKIATFISKFCAQYEKHNVERYCYGDGNKIGDAYPCKINGNFTFEYNWNELQNFNKTYGFVPVDDFSQPVMLIFQNDSLVEQRLITIKHCALLMEKFHSKNLLDLKAIVRDFPLMDVIF